MRLAAVNCYAKVGATVALECSGSTIQLDLDRELITRGRELRENEKPSYDGFTAAIEIITALDRHFWAAPGPEPMPEPVEESVPAS